MIFQPNSIIMTRQEFTPIEKRVFYLVVSALSPSVAKSNDIFTQNKVVEIHNARAVLGAKNFQGLKDACDRLNTRQMKYVDEKGEVFDFVVPFPRVRYKDGVVTVTIFADTLPSFMDLSKGFTSSRLKAAMSLNSRYSQRFYDILSQWKSDGYDRKTYEVEYLRSVLGLGNKYSKWSLFEKRILQTAQKELAEKTELSFKYTPIKRGRRFAEVLFEVSLTDEKEDYSSIESLVLDEKKKRALQRCDELGIYKTEYREAIVGPKQSEFWKLIAEIRNGKVKISTSSSGYILKRLGLI